MKIGIEAAAYFRRFGVEKVNVATEVKFIPINQSVISRVYPAACKFLISLSSFKLLSPRVMSSGVHSLTKILFIGFLFLASKNIRKEISSPSHILTWLSV